MNDNLAPFANRFNKDNTINFDTAQWQCTDVDQMQFCRKINDHLFEYIQLKDTDGDSDYFKNKNALDYLNGITTPNEWYQDIIDITDYSDDEIKEYLSAYGGILDNVNDEVDRNQIIAECIFEQDVVMVGY
ncbi:MAG: hypothetical protein VZR36_08810 [Prevotella sp.]|nr:hypothetical protein [Prevotella sp.]